MAGENEGQRESVDDLLPDDIEDSPLGPEVFDVPDDDDDDSAGNTSDGEGDEPSSEPPVNETADQKSQRLRDEKSGRFKPGQPPPAQGGKKPPQQPAAAAAPASPAPAQPQTVPLATFLQERNTLKQQLQQLQEQLTRLQNPPKAPEPPPAIPDHTTDPKGFVEGTVAAAMRKLEEANKPVQEAAAQAQQTAARSAEHAQHIEFVGHLQRAEEAFVSQNPDYYDALNHVRSIRSEQLRMLNPGIPDEHVHQIIGTEEMNLAKQFASQNRNPIQGVYELAKKFGYARRAAAPGAAQPADGLPPVQGGPRQLPPDQRLGTATGKGEDGEADSATDGGYKDPFDDAWGEMFARGKRRA